MNVEILTPDTLIYSGPADAIQLPGSDGSFGVLDNHAPIVASLKKGEVKIKINGQEQRFPINGGVVEVLNNRVIVLGE